MFPNHAPYPPLADNIWVSFDLETTGLDDNDAIIEIGAVKFRENKTLDTFQTLVNPRRRISPFIHELTGITQRELDRAPAANDALAKFAAFIGASPLIAQNAPFDLGFLERAGVNLANPVVDTFDLAYVVRPDLSSYALEEMAALLNVRLDNAHRALPDARATMSVFLALLEDANRLDAYTLAAMQQLARRSGWRMRYLLDALAANPRSQPSSGGGVGINGLDIREIGGRLQSGGALRPREDTTPLDPNRIAALLSNNGALANALPGFEERSEQIQMASAVANAINRGNRIIIEAGTGVGKSLAYLLPAALYALANDKRVVISTNTIGLQEQLMHKDVPIVAKALKRLAASENIGASKNGAGGKDGLDNRDNPDTTPAELRFTQLKGRSNYLCLRLWNRMRAAESPSPEEARMLAKTLVWLQTTATGDRAEINLGTRGAGAPWDRLSSAAQAAAGCMRQESVCFLRAAREQAAASHLVIVNHALLLSDITTEGSIIPDYDVLIIDEAHHLEDVATRQLGYDLTRARAEEHLQALSGEGGLPNQTSVAFRTASVADARREEVAVIANEIGDLVPRARPAVSALFARLQAVAENSEKESNRGRQNPYGHTLRVTPALRSHPAWSDIEIDWENADLALSELGRLTARLETALGGLEDAGLLNYEALLADVAAAAQSNADLRGKLKDFVTSPDDETIYWLSLSARRRELSLNTAPLHVADKLDELLFSRKQSVVMTSATLAADGDFAHITERSGFRDADELQLGSPFDYPNAAVLCLPTDMPPPNTRQYDDAVHRAIRDSAIAAGGRSMALFTSYGALRKAAAAIKDDLQSRGISVLTQGNGRSPDQIKRRFMDDPKAVLLGAASFWEGVDMPGDALSVLIVAKLPFVVPTDPVFLSRSELYDNGFMEYALPQAILRLRQGFGRLIRASDDRGAVVILDNRLATKRYGASFLRSLPPARQTKCRLADIPRVIGGHLRK